jgi:TetR/AcrR family transcriptional repressor of nem operon
MNATQLTHAPVTKKGEETKARILQVARELIHARGYKNTGLQDILDASGVPKGSFYLYFRSKEDLGRELIVTYRQTIRDGAAQRIALVAERGAIPQIVEAFRHAAQAQSVGGCRSGCLLGNLAAEITDSHLELRREIAACFQDLMQAFADVLEEGQRRGELTREFETQSAAAFLVSVMEGTVLVAKARREPATFLACENSLVRYLDTLRASDARKGGTT